MKVLLTGASGFVGSHILDTLKARGIPTAVLLRPTSSRQFLQEHDSVLEVREGSIGDTDSLRDAVKDCSHLLHCAGLTRARQVSDFYAANQVGTRNVVTAVNACSPKLERFLHISSLAAAGPATPSRPARETDNPAPVSEYGKSKLAGELEVRAHCQVPYTVVRPPAVYGPRDLGFLSMFRAVKNHILPRPSETQALSLVFVRDLAEAVVTALFHPAAAGKTYFVAAKEVMTASRMAAEIASQMHSWTLPCPLPSWILWPVCLAAELNGKLMGKAMLLNLQKFAELRAPGWVCDPGQLEQDLGIRCPTYLRDGIAQTVEWYRRHGWL